MNDDSVKPTVLDPVREAGYLGIRILDRVDGGREFIFPAARNLSEKLSFSLIWLVMTASLIGFGFLGAQFVNAFPAVIGFFILNHLGYFLLILGLFVLVLTIVCLDMWLRSSRVIAAAGQLQTVTRWLCFKRTVNISAASIIEIRVAGNTSVGETVYYDIVVLAVGEKPGWIASRFPAERRPDSSFTENDLKVFNSGGRKIAVATGINGKPEADWLAAEIRLLLKLDNAAPSPSIGP